MSEDFGVMSPYCAAACRVFTIRDQQLFDYRVTVSTHTLVIPSLWSMTTSNRDRCIAHKCTFDNTCLGEFVGELMVLINILSLCGRFIRASACLFIVGTLSLQTSAPWHMLLFCKCSNFSVQSLIFLPRTLKIHAANLQPVSLIVPLLVALLRLLRTFQTPRCICREHGLVLERLPWPSCASCLVLLSMLPYILVLRQLFDRNIFQCCIFFASRLRRKHFWVCRFGVECFDENQGYLRSFNDSVVWADKDFLQMSATSCGESLPCCEDPAGTNCCSWCVCTVWFSWCRKQTFWLIILCSVVYTFRHVARDTRDRSFMIFNGSWSPQVMYGRRISCSRMVVLLLVENMLWRF